MPVSLGPPQGILLGALLLAPGPSPATVDVGAVDRDRILSAAAAALKHPPVTVTAASSPRSAGGPHDFFSEADYWWPDPGEPGRARTSSATG